MNLKWLITIQNNALSSKHEYNPSFDVSRNFEYFIQILRVPRRPFSQTSSFILNEVNGLKYCMIMEFITEYAKERRRNSTFGLEKYLRFRSQRLTIVIIMGPNFHELIACHFFELTRGSVTETAHEIGDTLSATL